MRPVLREEPGHHSHRALNASNLQIGLSHSHRLFALNMGLTQLSVTPGPHNRGNPVKSGPARRPRRSSFDCIKQTHSRLSMLRQKNKKETAPLAVATTHPTSRCFHPDAQEVLKAMRTYIGSFFGCRACADHFENMAAESLHEVHSLSTSVLWLWKRHNHVNNRLAGKRPRLRATSHGLGSMTGFSDHTSNNKVN